MCAHLGILWYDGCWLSEVIRFTTSILQMSKLEFLKVELFAQGHADSRKQIQSLSLSDLRACLISDPMSMHNTSPSIFLCLGLLCLLYWTTSF